jgi:DNA-binding response OmpR family regulator
MAEPKILIVEDEKSLVKALKYNLEKEGYRVAAAADGEAGLAAFAKDRPDLVIVDVMLPKLDGFEFVKRIRRDAQTPILMLTARKEEVDRVLGLELGADDYVTKPFSLRELAARVKAILKRGAPRPPAGAIRAGSLELDLERYEVRVRGKAVSLSPKEFEFLRCLAVEDGRAVTRDALFEKVWGFDKSMEIDSNTIDQHIARLRAKLGAEAARIVTVKNVGYRLKLD